MAISDNTPADPTLRAPPLCQADILALATEQVHKAVALTDVLSQFAAINQHEGKRRVLLYNETMPTLLAMLAELLVEVEERIEEASQVMPEVTHG